MIHRTIETKIRSLARRFPIVGLVGPRQSGKTYLARSIYPSYTYVSLEELDNRVFAQEDPRGFLDTYNTSVIIDEIQKVPSLFSYIQTAVDTNPVPGRYIITGSQNFLLHQHISQSLAGRIALLTLLPLTLSELERSSVTYESYEQYIYRGMYPRIYDAHIDPNDWYPNYIQTYIERDVRDITHIENLPLFQTFIRLCAGRIGQVVNYSSLAHDCGITHNTAKAWLGLLQTSYIIYLLEPYYENFGKRLTKMPKLYFYDTGVACSLLGIQTEKHIGVHFLQGGLFENFVLSEYIKRSTNQGHTPSLYYWRDKSGHEIDLLIPSADAIHAIEIKSSKTITGNFFQGLNYLKNLLSSKQNIRLSLVYGGTAKQKRLDVEIRSWKSF